jgi:Tfp pilus assembly protein PilE
VSSTPSRPTTDGGFTLVELVMAIVVLFIAMAAATQIIVSMVAATVANRHVDLAMSVATQTMESSIAYDCGGQLLDPAAKSSPSSAESAATQAFYAKLQSRCLVDTNSATPVTSTTDDAACTAAQNATNDPFKSGFVPPFDQLQNDLGSRRFTVLKSAASFRRAADGSATSAGILPVCTTVRLTWKFVTSVPGGPGDDGTNNSLRLQRNVHVQWFEPRQTTIVRFRDLTQLSALPPDAKVAVNQGRISVVAGLGKSAKIKMLNSTSDRFVTYAADDKGVVIFPFLPDGQFSVTTEGSPSPALVTLGSAGRSVCLKAAGTLVQFDSTCHS